MSNAEISHAVQVFSAGTEVGPQIPTIATLQLLDEVIIPGELTVAQLTAMPFDAGTADRRYANAEAIKAHEAAGMPPIRMEDNAWQHARAQVNSHLAVSVAALARGSLDVDAVPILREEDVRDADLFLAEGANRLLLFHLVDAIRSHLQQSEAAQTSLAGFKSRIGEISIRLAGAENKRARKEALIPERERITRELEPEVRTALAPYADTEGLDAFMRALLLPDSSPELLRDHRLIP